jgi:acyl-CoA synthetase (AMP-forming)/AMP-acid ligase II
VPLQEQLQAAAPAGEADQPTTATAQPLAQPPSAVVQTAAVPRTAVRAVIWTDSASPLQGQTVRVPPTRATTAAAAAAAAGAGAGAGPATSAVPSVPGWISYSYPYGLAAATATSGVQPAQAAEWREELLDVTAVGSEEDAFHMYYTSGTTGKPKGVLLSHKIVVLHAIGTILGELTTSGDQNIPAKDKNISASGCQCAHSVSSVSTWGLLTQSDGG